MEILKKLDELQKRFDKSTETIEGYQKAIKEVEDEQKRMQGEYRLLVSIGQEEGIVDENGQPVKNKNKEIREEE